MEVKQRFANVLTAWGEQDRAHTQAEFARLVGLHPTGVGRMFKGEQRPDLETMAQILAGLKDHPALARDLLEAYLLDDVPDTIAADGVPWLDKVTLEVAGVDSSTTRIREDSPRDPLEEALKRFVHMARTTVHGRNFVLGLDQWSKSGPIVP